MFYDVNRWCFSARFAFICVAAFLKLLLIANCFDTKLWRFWNCIHFFSLMLFPIWMQTMNFLEILRIFYIFPGIESKLIHFTSQIIYGPFEIAVVKEFQGSRWRKYKYEIPVPNLVQAHRTNMATFKCNWCHYFLNKDLSTRKKYVRIETSIDHIHFIILKNLMKLSVNMYQRIDLWRLSLIEMLLVSLAFSAQICYFSFVYQ